MLKPDMCTLPLPELDQEENRIKLCYAFLRSGQFYHQELAVANPNPKQFDPAYIMPRDMYAITHHVDQDDPEDIPSLETIHAYVKQNPTMITCIGSHREDLDRSIQIIMLPRTISGLPSNQHLMIQFLVPLKKAEKNSILVALAEAFYKQ